MLVEQFQLGSDLAEVRPFADRVRHPVPVDESQGFEDRQVLVVEPHV